MCAVAVDQRIGLADIIVGGRRPGHVLRRRSRWTDQARAAPYLLLTQWRHPQADQEATADEFATTMMVMFELGANARSLRGRGREGGCDGAGGGDVFTGPARAVTRTRLRGAALGRRCESAARP